MNTEFLYEYSNSFSICVNWFNLFAVKKKFLGWKRCRTEEAAQPLSHNRNLVELLQLQRVIRWKLHRNQRTPSVSDGWKLGVRFNYGFSPVAYARGSLPQHVAFKWLQFILPITSRFRADKTASTKISNCGKLTDKLRPTTAKNC